MFIDGGSFNGDGFDDDDDEDDFDDEEEDEDGDVDLLPEFANDNAKNIHAENKQIKELLEKVEIDAVETKNRYVLYIYIIFIFSFTVLNEYILQKLKLKLSFNFKKKIYLYIFKYNKTIKIDLRLWKSI